MNICKIKEVCQVNPPKKIPLSQDTDISFVPMSAVSTDGKVDLSEVITVEKVKSLSVFKDGDVIFAKITPCMENGKGAVVSNLKNGYGAGSTEFTVLRPNETHISEKWLYYYLSQKHFRWTCQQNMTGSAGQKRVPAKYLAECLIPVPPLEEQQRIVARIEELFSELDAAVATLERTKEQLAVYRQAVLKEAFEKYPSEIKSLSDFIEKPRYGTSKKCEYLDLSSAVPVYRIPNIDYIHGIISKDDIKSAEFTDEEKETWKLNPGDILVIRSNGSVSLVGRASLITESDTDSLFAGYLIRLRILNQEILYPKYLLHFLSTHEARTYIELKAKSTSGVNNINSNELKDLKIRVCNIEHQIAVVSEIESRLSVCHKIEETVNTALQEAEAMRQSILKQAFAGEL